MGKTKPLYVLFILKKKEPRMNLEDVFFFFFLQVCDTCTVVADPYTIWKKKIWF